VERAAFANANPQTFAATALKYWEIIADKLSVAGARFALLVFVVASATLQAI
jgi:hypothetical protein